METIEPRTREAQIDAGRTIAIGERIVTTDGVRGGKPRIAGRRVTVADVAIWYERMGMNPDEIVLNHPSLTLSDVHIALAYYYEHREQIDAAIMEDDRIADEMKGKERSIFEKARALRNRTAANDSIPS